MALIYKQMGEPELLEINEIVLVLLFFKLFEPFLIGCDRFLYLLYCKAP